MPNPKIDKYLLITLSASVLTIRGVEQASYAVILMSVIIIARCLGNHRSLHNRIIYLIGAFVLFTVIRTLFAMDWAAGIFRIGILLSAITTGVAVVLAIRSMHDIRNVIKGLAIGAAINILMIILGLDSSLMDIQRASGVLGQSNSLAVALSITALYQVSFINPVRITDWLNMILFASSGAIYSGSRKSLIGFVIIILYWANGLKQSKRILSFILITGLLMIYASGMQVGILEVLTKNEAIDRTVTAVSGQEGSYLARLNMVQDSMVIFTHNPLVGWGMGQYRYLTGSRWSYSHNNYSELAISGGSIGLLLFYGIYLALWRQSRDCPTHIKTPIRWMIVMFTLLESGYVTFYDKLQWMSIAILYCVTVQKHRINEN